MVMEALKVTMSSSSLICPKVESCKCVAAVAEILRNDDELKALKSLKKFIKVVLNEYNEVACHHWHQRDLCVTD